MKIYELVILKKLRLSEKFPRSILCAWKLALGIGIIKLSTIIAIIVFKLYLEHKRLQMKVSKIITVNK